MQQAEQDRDPLVELHLLSHLALGTEQAQQLGCQPAMGVGMWGAEWVGLRGHGGHWRRVLVSLGWSEGEGHLRKTVVTEEGSWFLANKPWIPSSPSPKHTSCLLSFYTAVGRRGGLLEMR